jgi:hypothetical protein
VSVEQQTSESTAFGAGEPPADAPPLSLLVVRGSTATTYPLPEQGRVLIGRSPHATICVDDRSISREHAALHLGDGIRIEDLASANGTRVQSRALASGELVELVPDMLIELGQVLLVVQRRREGQASQRWLEPAPFELCCQEESRRAADDHAPLALARLEVEGALAAPVVSLLVVSALAPQDLVCSPAPGRYEILLREATMDDAEARLERVAALLRERGLTLRLRVSCSSRDGRVPRDLKGPDSSPVSSGVRRRDQLVAQERERVERARPPRRERGSK